MNMGWSMNELYSQLYASSIIESYNNAGKNGVSLIKKAQKYREQEKICNHACVICTTGPKRR